MSWRENRGAARPDLHDICRPVRPDRVGTSSSSPSPAWATASEPTPDAGRQRAGRHQSDGALEPIDYPRPRFFRFPLELAERVIRAYSATGDWILDPFCGFGTTLLAAQRLGRHAIGFERDPERGHVAAAGVQLPNRVIVDDARRIAGYALPRFDLLFSNPPYTSFRDWDDQGFAAYKDDLRQIFTILADVVRPGGRVVLEICNVRDGPTVRTLPWLEQPAAFYRELLAFLRSAP